MKRLFKGVFKGSTKRTILNVLGMLVVMGTTVSATNSGVVCSYLLYEPERPELLGKVTKEELLGIKK